MDVTAPAEPLPVEAPATRTRHLPHLDSLRGLAALGVVLHHAHFEAEPVGGLRPFLAWLRQGHYLVTFFIVLSGFCLALPMVDTGRLRSGAARFILRRGRRLLPAYYASLAISLLLVFTLIGTSTGRHWDYALPVTGESIATHIFLVHNYELADLYKINHVFWSIAVEWQVYFAFPILLWLGRKVGPWWTTAVALIAGYVGFYLLRDTTHSGLTPHYYGMFALGMLGAMLAYGRRWESTQKDVSWWTLAFLSMIAMAVVRKSVPGEVSDLPFGVACLALLVATAGPGRLRSALEWWPLVALGSFSYSLYLVHAPVQHLILKYGIWKSGVPIQWEFPILTLVGTPLILGLSYLFHLAFERPFLATRPAKLGPAPVAGRRRIGSPERPGPSPLGRRMAKARAIGVQAGGASATRR